jgi:hypothetical protein
MASESRASSKPPKMGELYSHLYIERGDTQSDSSRFRARLGQYVETHFAKEAYGYRSMIIMELGVVDFPGGHTWENALGNFFRKSPIADVLSAVTLIYRKYSGEIWQKPTGDAWRDFVQRALREENVGYSIDSAAGIHPIVDKEFDRNLVTALRGLEGARYNAVRTAFEASTAKLAQVPTDTKGAIRDIFEALETLTKLISASGKSLTAAFIKAELEPRLQKLSGDPVTTMSSARSLQSLSDWVDAAHPYRHGHEAENPVNPPVELVILLASQGASFLRWLADIDRQLSVKG